MEEGEGSKFSKKYLLALCLPLLIVLLIGGILTFITGQGEGEGSEAEQQIVSAKTVSEEEGIPTDEFFSTVSTTVQVKIDAIPTRVAFSRIAEGQLQVLSAKNDINMNYTVIMQKCGMRGGSPTFGTTEKMIKDILNEGLNMKHTASCSLIYLGMRLRLDNWFNKNGSLRIYNAVVSSLWDQESYGDLAHAESKCAVLKKFDSKLRFSPHDCNYPTNCYLCQIERPTCKYGICYSVEIQSTTVEKAEAQCQEQNGTLATPASLLLLRQAEEEMENTDINNKCHNTSVGFIRQEYIENYFEEDVQFSLLHPFTEKRTHLNDICVGIDLRFRVFTRIDCHVPGCGMCTFASK